MQEGVLISPNAVSTGSKVDHWWTTGGPLVDHWWTTGGPLVDHWWTTGGPLVDHGGPLVDHGGPPVDHCYLSVMGDPRVGVWVYEVDIPPDGGCQGPRRAPTTSAPSGVSVLRAYPGQPADRWAHGIDGGPRINTN
ncbi:hypothetical protein NHX12_004088 [Muraenolepis orangiensis]|uniref:Uncharacterized protein n=1 Tax=Muraenolepis orangiensis TaxID=630683 RepID=A0A9Q0DW35_9TELE|nr:hypothetical protein NHX12_004088 [Muraenolepis orangiensis]